MIPVEGLRFAYALHPLPPGRFGFSRWRYELWHGAGLHAAGWCPTRRGAERALRRHAARVGHAIFGLRPDPRVIDAVGAGPVPRGASVRLDAGPVHLTLVPRAIEEELRAQVVA
jgi:hypothetical protein